MREHINNSMRNQNNVLMLDNEFLSIFPLKSIECIKSLNGRIIQNENNLRLLVV